MATNRRLKALAEMSTYEIKISRKTEFRVAAWVTSPKKKRYGVHLRLGFGSCSCEDSVNRPELTCKHQFMVLAALGQLDR